MRIGRDRMVDLALKTLAEQVELARLGTPPPSHGVRLALAVLHGYSDGARAPFDNFWMQMRDDGGRTSSDVIADYSRTTHLQTQLRGVMRAVGIAPSVSTEQPLWDAALKVYPRKRHAPDGKEIAK